VRLFYSDSVSKKEVIRDITDRKQAENMLRESARN
jgi:hypothetical protein